MNTRKNLLSLAAFAFGLGLAIGPSAQVEAAGETRQTLPPKYPDILSYAGPERADRTLIAVRRPTPPSTRALDPSATPPAGLAREEARELRDIPLVRADPQDFIQNATDLVELEVQNREGQRLGTVEDVAIDITTGQLVFIAVGPGDIVRPVPPQAFDPMPEERRLVLDTTLERWHGAPAFERQEIELFGRPREAQRIYRFHRQDYREAVAAVRPEPETRERIFGAPARRPAHRAPDALPGDPTTPRAVPEPLPPDRTEIHSDLRWEREFGTPADRLTTQEERERRMEAQPSLKNPRLHYSQRGIRREPHVMGVSPMEFGAPPRRHERVQWASDLIGQGATDATQQHAGEVSDFILDLHSGQVQHVIVTDPGAQQYAIPMRNVHIDRLRQAVIEPDLSALRDAPLYEERAARLQPYQAFRYEGRQTPEFGAPEPPAR